MFVRTRYSSPLFLGLSTIAGLVLSKLAKRKFAIPTIIIMLLFLKSVLAFASLNVGIYRGWIATILRNESKGEKFGFIEDNGAIPLEFIFEYKVDNLTAVNLLKPKLFENIKSLEKKHLEADGKFYEMSDSEIRLLFKQNQIENYFYRLRIDRDRPSYFDPKRQVLRILDEPCKQSKIIPLDFRSIIFVFRSCVF